MESVLVVMCDGVCWIVSVRGRMRVYMIAFRWDNTWGG